eukprot:GCRY01000855.1.p1 GENE.GCRY01000855.1~~GCRY01000855.1.p1  ORF type:complete len:747 (-),score=158.47 GCRY01000855.1:377-2617(-)
MEQQQGFHVSEDKDGVRFNWRTWPPTRLEATRMVNPLSCLYTPLKRIENLPLVGYDPVTCKGCKAVLNPFCAIDTANKMWTCPFCFHRNGFPANYSQITETNLPPELIPNYTTIEYALRKGPAPPPAYIFVVDTCIPDEELEALKQTLILGLSIIPSNAFVGLISFGKMVQVHEIGFAECAKSYVFKGTKEYSTEQVRNFLGIRPATAPGQVAFNKYVMPLSQCEEILTTILEDLSRDPWPREEKCRPERCTGAAMSVAVSLAESIFPGMAARIMVLMGGPCTIGPGQNVDLELAKSIRQHADLIKGSNIPHLKKAVKFYEGLTTRLVKNNHVVDVLGCAYDQTGLLEMRSCCLKTGGHLIMCDEFGVSTFKQTFQRIFSRDKQNYLEMAFSGTLEVQTSRELKLSGAIGLVSSLNKKGPVSDAEIGIGGTCAWKVNHLDPNSTVALYFDVVNQQTDQVQPGQRGHVQFLTQYQHSSGQWRLRVTTVAHGFAANDITEQLAQGFDQETAAVCIARIATFKSEREPAADVLRWLDRMLIRLVSRFAKYTKDDASSFRLHHNFGIYPQFMFHLRRSHFLQVFNSSPDETAYYRNLLYVNNANNSLVMIQPTLLAYSFNGPPTPVLLDSTSVQPDRILLFDTFFHVVVYHGTKIMQWREHKYHEDPNHVNFKNLLQAPKDDAKILMKNRFPVSRYVETDHGGSQARLLMSKINPSITQKSISSSEGLVRTEDVSFEVFISHLQKLAVQS